MNKEIIDKLTTSNETVGQPITGRRLLLALGSGIGMAIVIGLITGFGLARIIPGLSNADWLATVITTEVYLCLIAGHLIYFGGFKGLCTKLQLNHTSWRFLGLTFLVWVSIWAVLVLLYLILSPVLESVKNAGAEVVKVGSLYGRLEHAGPALFALAIFQPVFVTPLAEELIFRGSFYGWLRQKRGATFAIVLSSIAFALYHPSILLWPTALLLGLGGAWIRERSGSLTPFLIMHMLNSIAMIIAAYFISGWQVN